MSGKRGFIALLIFVGIAISILIIFVDLLKPNPNDIETWVLITTTIIQVAIGILVLMATSIGAYGFVSGKKQKHYKILDKYTFSVLSANLIRIKETHHQIGNTFSYYADLIPENSYRYADALEHMKKDKSQKRLDELIREYQDQIKKINATTTRNGDLILDQISSACGVDQKFERIKLGDICTFLNLALSHIREEEDIRNARSHGYTMDKDFKEVIQCANKLLEDEIILESYDEIRRDYRELKEIATKVQQKATSISQAIHDEDYDVTAKCCPSYVTIIKDLINYN